MPDAEKVATIFIHITVDECEISFENKNKVVVCSKLNFGTNQMDAAVQEYFLKKLDLMIGERTAQAVRTYLGNLESKSIQPMDVRARDVNEQVPRTINVTTNNVNEALSRISEAIVNNVQIVIAESFGDSAFLEAKINIISHEDGKGLGTLVQQLTAVTKLPVTISRIPVKNPPRWPKLFLK